MAKALLLEVLTEMRDLTESLHFLIMYCIDPLDKLDKQLGFVLVRCCTNEEVGHSVEKKTGGRKKKIKGKYFGLKPFYSIGETMNVA